MYMVTSFVFFEFRCRMTIYAPPLPALSSRYIPSVPLYLSPFMQLVSGDVITLHTHDDASVLFVHPSPAGKSASSVHSASATATPPSPSAPSPTSFIAVVLHVFGSEFIYYR